MSAERETAVEVLRRDREEANRKARNGTDVDGRAFLEQLTPRIQRALAKAQRLLQRVNELNLNLTDSLISDAAREASLLALEALVLSNRGSSEQDHRQQLFLLGLQAASDAYLREGAPDAARYAASNDQAALLAEMALRELRIEYPDEAAAMLDADVARAVQKWATR